MPGARVRVSSRARVEDDAAGPTGRAFLRLVDPDGADAGWVMEHHPTSFEPILVVVLSDDGAPAPAPAAAPPPDDGA